MELHYKGETNIIYKEHTIRNMQKKYQGVICTQMCKFKGIVHLNIIFSYMKVNKICYLDHPVY